MVPPKKPGVDVIDKILDACFTADRDSLFIQGLWHQYEERGSLSKKQLQGLYQKALKVKEMPPNWLATLEARILKMPTRYKSTAVQQAPVFTKDEAIGTMIKAILTKYPQHKRVLFLQSKYDNNESITTADKQELEKLAKLLLSKDNTL